MKASIVDMRRRTREIMRALDQNEPVTVFYRGKKKAVIYPAADARGKVARVSQHPAFGMWKGRKDTEDVREAVRSLRKVRSHAL